MKKLIYIALFVLMTTTWASAQGLYKLGDGSEVGKVQAVTEVDGDIYIIDVNTSSNYELKLWDGVRFTDFGVITGLPQHGNSSQGQFEVIDVEWYADNLYVVGSFADGYVGSTPNLVLQWDGNSWTDLSDQAVHDAYTIGRLVTYKDDLYLAGIFKSSGLLKLDGTGWSSIGTPLGSDKQSDFVVDVEVFGGKIYASGQFTQPFTGYRYSTAIYYNGEWKAVENPPFLRQSKHFATVGSELLLSGEANNVSDYVKAYTGSGWEDISAGLEDIDAIQFWDMAGYEDMLCLTGVFEKRATGERFNILMRNKSGWIFGESEFTNDEMRLLSFGTEIYVYGNFTYGLTSNMGELKTNSALLAGKLFLDENNNCVQDGSEKGLALTQVVLNPGGYRFYTDMEGDYEIPVQPGDYTLTYIPSKRHKFGCSKVISVTVDKHINRALPDLVAVEIPNIVNLELNSSLKNGWKLVRGEYNELKLIAANRGTTTIKGATLSMKMGDWWSELNMVPKPTSVDGDEYTWRLTNLEKDDVFEIVISGTAKLELAEVNDFCYTGAVDAPQTDIDADDNRETGALTTVNTIDAYTKQSSVGTWYTATADKIGYTIRFENLSDKTINKVEVRDTFDADMLTDHAWDKTNLGSSTHLEVDHIELSKYVWRYIYVWTSTDANLAPAGSPNGANVGVADVTFRIHEKGRKAGIELCNQAVIMLEVDEKFYAKTNTVCSYSTAVGIDPVEKNPSLVKLFPNPASSRLTIKSEATQEREIEIYNQVGELVHTAAVRPLAELQLDVSKFAGGIYFVKIVGFETQKLVVH